MKIQARKERPLSHLFVGVTAQRPNTSLYAK